MHAEWTPLVANVPEDVSCPVTVAAHNVETRIWERYLENERRLLHKAYIALQVRKVRRFEARTDCVRELVERARKEGRPRLTLDESFELLRCYGLPVAPCRTVTSQTCGGT